MPISWDLCLRLAGLPAVPGDLTDFSLTTHTWQGCRGTRPRAAVLRNCADIGQFAGTPPSPSHTPSWAIRVRLLDMAGGRGIGSLPLLPRTRCPPHRSAGPAMST